MMLKSMGARLVRPWLALALIALILVTRTNSSSLVLHPPDATLAVFFLAGLWVPSALVFALLFAAAALADQLSFMLGVVDWCFTPAYVFLVPTYACLWFAGYFCRGTDLLRVVGAARAAVSFLAATTVAYLVSTYSFLYFSGRVTTPRSIAAYHAGIAHYFPYYLGWAVFYAALALAIAYAVRVLRPTWWARLAK